MKTVRQLVDFIFHELKELPPGSLDLTESDKVFLEELNRIEPAKVSDSKPLADALREAGLAYLVSHLTQVQGEWSAELSDHVVYLKAVKDLFDAGKLYDLATRGWVAALEGDAAGLADQSVYRINFTDVTPREPEDTKGVDSEQDTFKAMNDIAVKSFTAHHGKPNTTSKSESQFVVESAESAADVVAELTKRATRA